MAFIKKSILILLFVSLLSFLFISCFNEKQSILFDSEWIMQNVDEKGQSYVHHLFLNPDYQAVFKVYYKDATIAVVWTGKYKLTSKKLIFNFDKCTRFENDKPVGQYDSTRIIKYFSGDYFYSVGLVGEENKEYHMDLIRPKDYFYNQNIDFFGNPMEEFTLVEK
ncbi:MAG: hypothetical protein GX297_00550 [Treponema sp.]|nr:hypothetical protein [Treponema sp.]